MAGRRLISVDFQIYGLVQGVFFRKFTQKEAHRLGLKGWCMNSERGTVVGSLQGEAAAVNDMKEWLTSIGSPKSKIDRAEFLNEKEISEYSFSDFEIRDGTS